MNNKQCQYKSQSEGDQFWIPLPQKYIDQLYDEYFVVLKQNILKMKKIRLGEHYIFYSKSKCINILNCILEQVRHPLVVTKGIRLTKGKQSIEIFGEIEKWYNYMKRFCFQVNFTSTYKLCSIDLQKDKRQVNQQPKQICKIRHKLTDEDKLAKIYEVNTCDPSISKELSILRNLNHKNLVVLEETFQTNQQIILVFQYFQGGNLGEIIENQKFSQVEIRLIIKNILEGVTFLHDHGIFHRDLKPENIIFDQKEKIDGLQIIDFALADQWNSDHKYLFTRCGTPGYVAPELLHDKKYGLTIDVYSIGIILYMLLTQINPFMTGQKSYDEIVMANYEGNVDYSGIECSGECLDLLMKCLKVDPHKRITAREALTHSFIIGENHIQNQHSFRTRKQFSIQSKGSFHGITRVGSIESPRPAYKKTIHSLHTESPIDSTSDSPITPNYQQQNILHRPQLSQTKGNSFRISKFKK